MKKVLLLTVALSIALVRLSGDLRAGALSELSKKAAEFVAEHLRDHATLEFGHAVEKYIRCKQNPASCEGLDPTAVRQFKELSPNDVAAIQQAAARLRDDPAPPIAPNRPLTGR
ncbi:MAG TPA: hypothetical protein VL048_05715 [Xanthobacteraceae bacterium]|jgi:hypothetical protein|nr:hypothetical protein [Xanthobacteraceae bacterium]